MKIIIPLLFILITICGSMALPFEQEGEITENGDDRWDDGEYDYYKFKIEANYTLQIEINSTEDAVLYIVLGYLTTPQEIENALLDIINNGYSENVLLLSTLENKFAKITYKPSTLLETFLTIFSINTDNPPVTHFIMKSNLPVITEVTDAPGVIVDNSNISIYLILVALIIVIIYYIRRQNRKTINNNIHNINIKQENNTEMQPSATSLYCYNCGNQMKTKLKFCYKCGTEL